MPRSDFFLAKVRCLGNSIPARGYIVNQILASSSDRQVFRSQMRREAINAHWRL